MKIFYADETSWTELGNFVFVLNEVSNTLYKFEGILKEFWIILKSHNDFYEIVQKLLAKYDVDIDTLEKDLINVVQALEDEELLIRS